MHVDYNENEFTEYVPSARPETETETSVEFHKKVIEIYLKYAVV